MRRVLKLTSVINVFERFRYKGHSINVTEATSASALFPVKFTSILKKTSRPVRDESKVENLRIKKEKPAVFTNKAPHARCETRVMAGHSPISSLASFTRISSDLVYAQSSFRGNSPSGFIRSSTSTKRATNKNG